MTKKGAKGPRMMIEYREGFWETLGVIARLCPVRKTKIAQEVGKYEISRNWHNTKSRVYYLIKSRKNRDDDDMIKHGIIKEVDNKYFVVTFWGFLKYLAQASLENYDIEEINAVLINTSKLHPHIFFKLWNFILNDNHKEQAHNALYGSLIWKFPNAQLGGFNYECSDIDNDLNKMAYSFLINYLESVGENSNVINYINKNPEIKDKLIKIHNETNKQMEKLTSTFNSGKNTFNRYFKFL